MNREPLGDLLRSAYRSAPGCPDESRWAALAGNESMTGAEREAMVAHAAGCPACAAELELARAFADAEAAGEENRGSGAGRSQEIEAIVARLREQGPLATGRGGRLLRFPARVGAARGRWLTGLAAAAALIAAVALWRTPGRVPRLDAPPIDSEMRGGEVELLAPAGDLSVAPSELAWVPVPAATNYRVEIVRADATPLWQAAVVQARAAVPPEIAVRFGVAVRWSWRVTALDAAGVPVARSEWRSFSIRPPGAAEPAPPR